MIRLRSDCLRCLLKHADDAPASAPEALKTEYLQGMFRILADAGKEESAPLLLRRITALKNSLFGASDDYEAVKFHFNEFMLSMEPRLRRGIAAAEDPLLCAMQYALAGNYIDFGAMQHIEEEKLTALFDSAGTLQPDAAVLARLRAELARAESLLYITDNCGEIVADKLLIEVLQKLYPQLCIKVLVRGEPVLNDATMADARQVGLAGLVPVIGSGSGIAGTCFDFLSPEALAAADAAQILLAKGQGNFETMRFCGRNAYYLFLCKCEMFAREFAVPQFSGILTHDSLCKGD